MKGKTFYIIRIIVIILTITLVYLCFPVYLGEQSDGGSKVWKAKIYTVVHWHKLDPEDEPKGWKIYIWPNNHKWESE